MADLKVTFITKCLADYNESVIAGMKIAAKRAGVGVTDKAIQSLAFKTFQQGGGAYSNLSFREYLRFVDMGVGRGHPLGGLTTTTLTLAAQRHSGKAFVKDKGRKPKKIYSKIAYGKLTFLQNKLLHGYTEETIAMLKAEMQNQPPA